MASPAFIERFKDRSSSLNRNGNLDVSGSKPVSASLITGSPSKMRCAGQLVVRGDSPNHKKHASFSYEDSKMSDEVGVTTKSVLRAGIGKNPPTRL